MAIFNDKNKSLTNNEKLTIVGSVVIQAPQVQPRSKQVLLSNPGQDEKAISLSTTSVSRSQSPTLQRLVQPLTPSFWFKVRYQNGGVKRHEPRVKTSLPVKLLYKYFHNKSPVCYSLLFVGIKITSQVSTGFGNSEILTHIHSMYIHINSTSQGFSWPKNVLARYARTLCVSLSIRAPHSCVLIRQEDTLINSITFDQNRTRVRL